MKESLNVILINAGKKFGKEWIFRNLSFEIKQGEKVVILGLNGSGKSTLLQALTGYLSLNEGELIYKKESTDIDIEEYYKYQSLASPYFYLTNNDVIYVKPGVNRVIANTTAFQLLPTIFGAISLSLVIYNTFRVR